MFGAGGRQGQRRHGGRARRCQHFGKFPDGAVEFCELHRASRNSSSQNRGCAAALSICPFFMALPWRRPAVMSLSCLHSARCSQSPRYRVCLCAGI
eukprot:11149973-Alexandrium_andersonii.AAC.1